MKRIFCLLILLYGSKYLMAQDTAKLSSDKPDQTDGANVLKKGEFQFETEIYHNTFMEGRAAVISSSLLRYGLGKNLEARLLAEDGRERDKFIDETTQSVYPLAVSVKVALLKNHPLIPDIVFITYVKMPLTKRTSREVYWSPAFILGFEKEVNAFTMAANICIKQSAFDETWSWQASADAKFELSKHVEVFTEYFAQYANHENPLHNLDTGLLYYLSNNCVIHVACGSTILTHQYNRFINTGFSFRIQ